MIKSCRIAFVCWPWLVAVAVAGGAPGWPLLPSGNLAKVLPLLLLLTLSEDASEVHSFPSLQADGQPAQGRTLPSSLLISPPPPPPSEVVWLIELETNHHEV